MSSPQHVSSRQQAYASDRAEHVEPGGATADNLLLRRVAGGDRQALAALYDRHSDAAFALAQQVCGGVVDGVVEGAFLALWRQARGGRVAGYPRARLLQITRERALDRLHDVGRRIPGGRQGSRQRSVSLLALSDHDARSALATVAPEERHCLELVYFDGLSVAEIAALTRLPAGCVSDRLRRGSSGVHRHFETVAGIDAPRTVAQSFSQ